MAIYINGKKVAGRGISGKSPYQIAVEGGYTGTEQDFNTQLVAIGDAVSGFNELSQQVTNAKSEIEQAISNVNTTVSSAKSEISTKQESAETAIDDKVTAAKSEIDTVLAQLPDPENIATKSYVDEKVNSLVTDIWYYGSEAPTNTKLLWIDSNSSTGGLKYYNNSSWVHVPVAWS